MPRRHRHAPRRTKGREDAESAGKKRAPQPASILDALVGIRKLVVGTVRKANWSLTLACVCASLLLWSLFPGSIVTHGFLLLSALCLGACVGRPIDRAFARRRKKPQ